MDDIELADLDVERVHARREPLESGVEMMTPDKQLERALERAAPAEPLDWTNGHAQSDAPATATTAARLNAIESTDRLGLQRLDEISDADPAPLLLDRIDPEGHTILFGPGGIGKGTLASAWMAGLVTEGHRC